MNDRGPVDSKQREHTFSNHVRNQRHDIYIQQQKKLQKENTQKTTNQTNKHESSNTGRSRVTSGVWAPDVVRVVMGFVGIRPFIYYISLLFYRFRFIIHLKH